MTMAIGTLYVEELRATMHGRFALLGTGVILLAIGCVATVGTQDTWLDGYGIIAYFLVPLAFIPLAAVFLASPRANRFVESLFTEPLAVRNLVGLVSDETSESQSTWTAREYLSYFARIRRVPNAHQEIERILDDVALAPKFRGKLICTYSTGMKRRVEIARALMGSTTSRRWSVVTEPSFWVARDGQ